MYGLRENLMKGNIDLHTHSTASDGSMTPKELVRHAGERGLSAIALTDHDTIDGIKEAVDAARGIGLEVVPGVEISVDYKSEMHILGYFLDERYLKLAHTLEQLRENRNKRNKRMIKKLNDIGFNISIAEVEAECRDKVVGRSHIAKVMYNKGYVSSIRSAFDKYLSIGGAAYAKKEMLTPGQGIGMIIEAGGLPVLAHPMYLNHSIQQLDDLLSKLVKFKLKGIEAYYVDNTGKDTEAHLKLAEKYKLFVTGGSDFHGSLKPDIEIGTGRGNLNIPYQLLDKMKEIYRSLTL